MEQAHTTQSAERTAATLQAGEEEQLVAASETLRMPNSDAESAKARAIKLLAKEDQEELELIKAHGEYFFELTWDAVKPDFSNRFMTGSVQEIKAILKNYGIKNEIFSFVDGETGCNVFHLLALRNNRELIYGVNKAGNQYQLSKEMFSLLFSVNNAPMTPLELAALNNKEAFLDVFLEPLIHHKYEETDAGVNWTKLLNLFIRNSQVLDAGCDKNKLFEQFKRVFYFQCESKSNQQEKLSFIEQLLEKSRAPDSGGYTDFLMEEKRVLQLEMNPFSRLDTLDSQNLSLLQALMLPQARQRGNRPPMVLAFQSRQLTIQTVTVQNQTQIYMPLFNAFQLVQTQTQTVIRQQTHLAELMLPMSAPTTGHR